MKEVFVSYIRRYVLTFYRTFNLDMGRSVFVSYIRRYVLTRLSVIGDKVIDTEFSSPIFGDMFLLAYQN